MLRCAVLVSGGGTNLASLIKAQEEGIIKSCTLSLVIADREAYALERAKDAGIEPLLISRKELGRARFEQELLVALEEREIDMIVLAGFLSILSPTIINKFSDRIINIHPSLIPSFCGKGYYGLKVHEAALEYGVKVTGATVHLVNEIPDGGKILLQKAVYIKDGDTPEILQRRVMEEAEWIILPQGVELLASKLNKELNK